MIAKLCTAFFVFTLLTHSWAGTAGLASDLVDEQADHTKPGTVYVMLGQSNTLGFGRVGPKETISSLEFLAKEKGEYSHRADAAGNWITRNDVDTQDLWRDANVSTVNQGHHYNHNAETNFETGDRLDCAMVESFKR